MQLTKIKDVENFKKDGDSGALLSIDNRALQAYKEKRKNKLVMNNEINKLKMQHSQISYDINNMKQELTEVKQLLTNFLSLQKGR